MSARGAAYIDTGLFEAGEDVMLNSLQLMAKYELVQLRQRVDSGKKQSRLSNAIQPDKSSDRYVRTISGKSQR
jgi:hypothetical protein